MQSEYAVDSRHLGAGPLLGTEQEKSRLRDRAFKKLKIILLKSSLLGTFY